MEIKEYSFLNLLSNIVDNRGKTCPTTDAGMPLIATNCIKNDHLYPAFEKIRFVSDSTYDNWFRGHPEPNDIIFVCKGSPGRVAWTPDPVPFCIAQDMVAIRANESIVDAKFLFALLRSNETQQKILNMHVGSLIPHFKKGDFKNLYLSIPVNKAIQIKIGEIYFNISKKIEINSQINQTLEAMAQALFKSWFVDFEPVKAKMTAKAAGADAEGMTLAAMEALSGQNAEALAKMAQTEPDRYAELKATAELFPDALVDSELGEIPAGWQVKPLSQTVELIGGGTPQKSNPDFWNGDIRWFSVKDAPNDGDVFVIDTESKITALGLHKSSTKLLDVGTTIISARGTVGKLALVGRPTAMNQSCYGVQGINGAGPYLNYFRLKQAIEDLKRNTHGAVFDTITRTTFDSVFTVDFNSKLKLTYEKTAEKLMLKIKSNLFESQHLKELRDTLLPKLLSGEVSVADV